MNKWSRKRFGEDTGGKSTAPTLAMRPGPGHSIKERLRDIASQMDLPKDRTPKESLAEEAAELATKAGITLPGKSLNGDVSFLEDYTFRKTNPMEAVQRNAAINYLFENTVPADKRGSASNNNEKLDAIAHELGFDVEAEQAKPYDRRIKDYAREAGIK